MTPQQAAEHLAKTMNEIEAAGYILYPHPRPVGISVRVSNGSQAADHPEKTKIVSQVWDQGDGKGWITRIPT